jgi:hypothetical protein
MHTSGAQLGQRQSALLRNPKKLRLRALQSNTEPEQPDVIR